MILAGPHAFVLAQDPPIDAELIKKAQAIHDRVIILDSHVDIAVANFTGERNYTERLDNQFNLPKMFDGGVSAVFLVVYVGQTTEARDPDRRIKARGKKAALIGVENGYPIGEEIGRVKEFFVRGGRYLSLSHNGHSQLSDSNTGERDGWKWNGLSPLGKQVITEMNKVGLMIDVSHPSKVSMMQTLELSKAPIIASHSAVRALCDVSRNMDDEQLLALKKSGGVMQVVAYSGYIKTPKPDSPERMAALATLRREFSLPEPPPRGQRGSLRAALAQLTAERREESENKLAIIDEEYPGDPPASVKDLIDHIDYAVKLIGLDHVGITSDFDGGGGITGWNDASETFNVTLELVRRGYTEEQIGKLWGGNLLRVMDKVQHIASELRKTE